MIKGLKLVTEEIPLYHLSLENHDGETFKPRVINSGYYGEDETHKRICFSSSIAGAFRAITNYDDEIMDLYVHVPKDSKIVFEDRQVFKPSKKLVPDVGKTKEHWVREKVELKCIGIVHIYFDRHRAFWQYPHVIMRWVEKF